MRLRPTAPSVRVALVLVAVLVAWPYARTHLFRARPPRPDDATFAQSARVHIVRDTFGVAHVFGQSDADAAFGMAYAHAEDDFGTIQDVLAASRGRLALLHLSKLAIENDFYARLVGIREQLDAEYDALPADVRAVLEAYARGFDLYAYLHPAEADGRFFPVTGRDVAGGFIHKLPLMVGFAKALSAVNGDKPLHVGDSVLAESDTVNDSFPGSNAHAVAASRSSDGVTRLNVNSHQPWEGPVAWYEIQVHSEEGWNMTGGRSRARRSSCTVTTTISGGRTRSTRPTWSTSTSSRATLRARARIAMTAARVTSSCATRRSRSTWGTSRSPFTRRSSRRSRAPCSRPRTASTRFGTRGSTAAFALSSSGFG